MGKKNGPRLLALLSCAAVLSVTAGCSLARNEDGEEAAADRLCGFFITAESVEVLYPDKFEKTPGAVLAPMEWSGRIYAQLVDVTVTDPDGSVFTTKDFVFEDLPGYPMFVYTVPADGVVDAYIGSACDWKVISSIFSIYPKKGYIKGSMSILPGLDFILYANHVYQSPDGKVYLVPAMGFRMGGSDEGSPLTITQSQTFPYFDNGKEETGEFTAEIRVDVMLTPQRVSVFAMNSSHRTLDSFSCDADKTPLEYTPPENTEFLLVETRKSGPDGNVTVSRQLVGAGQDTLCTHAAGKDGISVVMRFMSIRWPGGNQDDEEV